MNKYKAGDKFIIEIKQPHIVCGDVRYECEGMVLWIPEEDLDNMSQLVQGVDQYSRMKGQQEAWELAQRFVNGPHAGGLTTAQVREIFDEGIYGAIANNTYAEAAAKVEAWEKGIQAGDVVENRTSGRRGVVTSTTDTLAHGITDTGYNFMWFKVNCTKTGRHIDIEAVLAQIGE